MSEPGEPHPILRPRTGWALEGSAFLLFLAAALVGLAAVRLVGAVRPSDYYVILAVPSGATLSLVLASYLVPTLIPGDRLRPLHTLVLPLIFGFFAFAWALLLTEVGDAGTLTRGAEGVRWMFAWTQLPFLAVVFVLQSLLLAPFCRHRK